MAFSLETRACPGYLHVVAHGRKTAGTAMKVWAAISAELRRSGLDALLLEDQMSGWVPPSVVAAIAENLEALGFSKSQRIAIVESGRRKLFEDNRYGVRLTIASGWYNLFLFRTCEEARRWLEGVG